MKYLEMALCVVVLALFATVFTVTTASVLTSCTTGAPEVRPIPGSGADVVRPIKILGLHLYDKVTHIETAEEMQKRIDSEVRQRELRRGANLVYWGIIVALVCTAIHAGTSIKPLRQFVEWGIVGGVLAIVAGLWYKQTIVHEYGLALGLVVAVGGFLLYRFRNKSISRLPAAVADFFRKPTDAEICEALTESPEKDTVEHG